MSWSGAPVGQGWIIERSSSPSEQWKRSGPPLSFEYCCWSWSDPALAVGLPPGEHADAGLNERIDQAASAANSRFTFQFMPPQQGPPRGVVLFCPGLTGWEYQQPLVSALQRRGW